MVYHPDWIEEKSKEERAALQRRHAAPELPAEEPVVVDLLVVRVPAEQFVGPFSGEDDFVSMMFHMGRKDVHRRRCRAKQRHFGMANNLRKYPRNVIRSAQHSGIVRVQVLDNHLLIRGFVKTILSKTN